MKGAKKGSAALDKAAVRCAIYTRKSTEEGLERKPLRTDRQPPGQFHPT